MVLWVLVFVVSKNQNKENRVGNYQGEEYLAIMGKTTRWDGIKGAGVGVGVKYPGSLSLY